MITEFKVTPVEYLFEVEIVPLGSSSPMHLIISDLELVRLRDEINSALKHKKTVVVVK